MHRRVASEQRLQRIQQESRQRGQRISELERAHTRLDHLYEIGKLLLSLSEPDRVIARVIALMAETIPVRSAVLMSESMGMPSTIAWPCEEERTGQRSDVAAHALRAYHYLVDTADGARSRSARAIRDVGADRGRYIVLPLVLTQGSIFGILQIEGDGPLDEEALGFTNAVANQLSIAFERQALLAATQREQQLLTSVVTVVTSHLDRRTLLAAIARCVVPLFADVCLIDEATEGGAVRRIEVVFADESKRQLLLPQITRFAPRRGWKTAQTMVIESGRPLLFSSVHDPLAQGIAHDAEHAAVIMAAGTRSMLVLPLQARGRVLGALTFAISDSRRRYRARDLLLAELFASRVASALDNVALYESAQKATRMRDDLLAMVSHDLKNPLGSILMTSSSLLKLTGNADRRKASRKHLELIKRAALRMNRLIEDLLDVASIEGGQLAMSMANVELLPQLGEAIDAVQLLAAKKSLHIERDFPSQLPRVCADPARLQQVLVNLLGNAVKFTPAGGAITITIRVQATAGNTVVSISDTGPGIPAGGLPKLFDRFWRARRTATLGNGLGLFIVKGIVEAQGGKVWVDSQLEKGSTFSFTLRTADPEGSPCDAEPSCPA
jgi:signal transduction histidine kinase